MYAVSDAWKETHKQPLLPESFIEISVGIADVGVRDVVDTIPDNEAFFSNTSRVVGDIGTPTPAMYATLEHNLWVLDGSREIVPDDESYATPGYVSVDDTEIALSMVLSEVRAVTIPGFTITWSSEYGEYPTSFRVEVASGNTLIADTEITDNTSNVVEVPLEVSDYDCVSIFVPSWSMPDRRIRIDRISFGHTLTFGKNEVFGFTHSQTGCLNSSELPKSSIEFSLDNVDGRWNPSNPTGLEKYLSERQEVNVRYGLSVGDTVEWIKAGKFYLSSWRASPNGLEANFSARDIFEYLLNEPYVGPTSGTLMELATAALSGDHLPSDFEYVLDESLANYSANLTENRTCAEVVQMCANASGCVLYQDREGVLYLRPLRSSNESFVISAGLSYSHPEVELSKPLKAVSVKYGEDGVNILSVGVAGETQTVDNPLVSTEEQAQYIAEVVRDMLASRKTISGSFRADPRIDVFDIVSVDSKYGHLTPVAITEIRYDYNGSFRGTYEGRVVSNRYSLDNFILDSSRLGFGVLG